MIKHVRIFNSEVNYQNGEDIGPGFAVLVDPHPTTDIEVTQIAIAIENALMNLEYVKSIR